MFFQSYIDDGLMILLWQCQTFYYIVGCFELHPFQVTNKLLAKKLNHLHNSKLFPLFTIFNFAQAVASISYMDTDFLHLYFLLFLEVYF